MKKNLTTLAVILAIMGAAFAQTPQKTVFFTGKTLYATLRFNDHGVNSTGVPGADVTFITSQGDTLRAVSNETGRFTIPEVSTGKATVILEAAGYKRSTVEIDIEDNPRHRVHKHFEMEKAGDERDQ